MESVGVICEYNPFHNGHLRQIRLIREAAGEDSAVVCLMSGNYVQRGEPAIFPKQLRAEAALLCGADLVLELPLTVALSSAEGFASGGVSILSGLGCGRLCFGVETDDPAALRRTAEANLDPAFDGLLNKELESGCAYPVARRRALAALGAEAGVSDPNDILAVEYYKALQRQNSPMQAMPILRTGSYHAEALDPQAPSATALRAALYAAQRGGQWPAAADPTQACHSERGEDAPALKSCHSERSEESVPPSLWLAAVPPCLHELYSNAPVHSLAAGERAVLAILRTLPDAAFESLPYGSEGLWSKLMKNCRSCASVEEILTRTKSKRYALSRLRRMLLCAVLGLTAEDLQTPPSYVRILGFTDRGRSLLRGAKTRVPLINAGEAPGDAHCAGLERRASDLYSLFSEAGPRPAGEEARLRVCRIGQNETRSPSTAAAASEERP